MDGNSRHRIKLGSYIQYNERKNSGWNLDIGGVPGLTPV